MFHWEQYSKINSLGYNAELVDKAQQECLIVSISIKHKDALPQSDVKFITNHHRRFKRMGKKIVLRHWIILLHNPKLKSIIALGPWFVYKRVPNNKNIIASSKL